MGTVIGELRTRATLESKSQASDGGGGFSESWSALATVWCAIEPLNGNEKPSADQIVSFSRARIRIRFRDDVTAALRLSVGSRIFAIENATDPDGKRRWLDLLCVENAPS